MNYANLLVLPPYLYSGFSRLILSLVVLFLGWIVARWVTGSVRQVFRKVTQNKMLQDSPLGLVLEPANSLIGSGVLSSAIFALVLFVFIAWSGEILGITIFSQVIAMIVAYIPSVLSAVVVMLIGFVLSSVAERLAKQQFKRFAPSQGVLAGTVASSLTLVVFVLIALSELGIASNFILILFAGFVLMMALAGGIAFGFGSKDIVSQMLEAMITQENKRRASGKKSK